MERFPFLLPFAPRRPLPLGAHTRMGGARGGRKEPWGFRWQHLGLRWWRLFGRGAEGPRGPGGVALGPRGRALAGEEREAALPSLPPPPLAVLPPGPPPRGAPPPPASPEAPPSGFLCFNRPPRSPSLPLRQARWDSPRLHPPAAPEPRGRARRSPRRPRRRSSRLRFRAGSPASPLTKHDSRFQTWRPHLRQDERLSPLASSSK